MSRVVALDTSGPSAEVAVADDGQLRASAQQPDHGAFGQTLLSLLQQALSEARCDLQHVDAIAVVAGPGSFTGLRIGIMTAKTLAFARGRALMAAGTLDLMAHVAWGRHKGTSPRSIVSLVEAGAGHAFVSPHGVLDDPSATSLRRLAPPARLPLAQLQQVLSAYPAPLLLTARGGSALDAARSLAREEPQIQLLVAAALASPLAVLTSRGEGPAAPAEPFLLVPEYLSPSQAERAQGVDLGEVVHTITLPPPSSTQ